MAASAVVAVNRVAAASPTLATVVPLAVAVVVALLSVPLLQAPRHREEATHQLTPLLDGLRRVGNREVIISSGMRISLHAHAPACSDQQRSHQLSVSSIETLKTANSLGMSA